MNIKDGYALQLAIKKGYYIIIISGAVSEPVKDRLFKLGVTDVFMKTENKKQQLETILKEKKILSDQVLFMGDDIPDYEAMKASALPCCPADAAPEIKQISKYISSLKGGHGCVRDVIEKVLKLNNHWGLDTTVASK